MKAKIKRKAGKATKASKPSSGCRKERERLPYWVAGSKEPWPKSKERRPVPGWSGGSW